MPPPRKVKLRVIHEWSQPFSRNLNSYASKNSFKYETIDEPTCLLPKGGYMSVVGLQHDSVDAAGLQ